MMIRSYESSCSDSSRLLLRDFRIDRISSFSEEWFFLRMGFGLRSGCWWSLSNFRIGLIYDSLWLSSMIIISLQSSAAAKITASEIYKNCHIKLSKSTRWWWWNLPKRVWWWGGRVYDRMAFWGFPERMKMMNWVCYNHRTSRQFPSCNQRRFLHRCCRNFSALKCHGD